MPINYKWLKEVLPDLFSPNCFFYSMNNTRYFLRDWYTCQEQTMHLFIIFLFCFFHHWRRHKKQNGWDISSYSQMWFYLPSASSHHPYAPIILFMTCCNPSLACLHYQSCRHYCHLHIFKYAPVNLFSLLLGIIKHNN